MSGPGIEIGGFVDVLLLPIRRCLTGFVDGTSSAPPMWPKMLAQCPGTKGASPIS